MAEKLLAVLGFLGKGSLSFWVIAIGILSMSQRMASMHTWAILAGLRGLVVMITKRMDDIKLGGRHGGTLEGVGERYSQLIKIYA